MRLNNEGSYFPPSDNLNDVIKILEEIIKEIGDSKKISIGIDCNANNYYNETTKKYEMDGFKQPPDADGIIEYYLKYCTEHPSITYLEDPLGDNDISGWQKIYTKLGTRQNLTISSKNLVRENFNNLRNLCQLKEMVEINDLMGEDEKIKLIEENKLKSEENSKKILFHNITYRINELVTLTELFDCTKYMKNDLTRELGHTPGITLWDNAVENDNSIVIDIGLGLRSNLIILHGINNKSERVNKINRFLELIEHLY